MLLYMRPAGCCSAVVLFWDLLAEVTVPTFPQLQRSLEAKRGFPRATPSPKHELVSTVAPSLKPEQGNLRQKSRTRYTQLLVGGNMTS